MKSLFDQKDRQELLDRIARIRPDSPRRWGKMNPAQMFAHCTLALQTATGELQLKRSFIGRLIGPLVLKRILSKHPVGRNAPTAPEFIVADQRDFAAERSRLEVIVERFGERGPDGASKLPHPFFGKMTPDQWARLQWKHVDHHLMQFGG